MNTTSYRSSRKQIVGFLALIITLSALLLLVPAARAQGIIYGDSIPAGETVENDLILSGDTVRMDGTVQGDMLAFGNNVEVNGTVEGSLLAVGQNVVINGDVQGSLYMAGVLVTLAPEGAISRNMYSASLQLEMQSGSAVDRDVYAFSPGGAVLRADVGREFVGIIGPVELIRLFINWLEQVTGVDIFAPLLPADSSSSSLATLQAGLIPSMGELFQVDGQINWRAIGNWLLERLRELITLLALGALIQWLLYERVEQATRNIRLQPFSAAGWGLMVILAVFVLLGLFMISFVLVSLFFFGLTLDALGSIVLGLGIGLLAAAMAAFIIVISYVTKVIAAILIGQLILERPAASQAHTRLWPLVVGVLVYVLLRSIPFVGWLFGVLATLVGMGAMWLTYKQGTVTVTQEEPVMVAEPTAPQVQEA